MTATIKEIDISELRIPEYSQCPIPRLIDYLIEHFDPQLVNPLFVSKREDGKYYIIDGIHVFEAMKKLGYKKVLCRVVSGLTRVEEAQLRGGMRERKRCGTDAPEGS